MKKALLLLLTAIIVISGYSQISIERADYIDVGDEIPRIYYSFEVEGESHPADDVITNPLVFDDLDFPLILVDTLIYYYSSDYDVDNLFNADCAFFTRDGMLMHYAISDEAITLTGVQSQMPFSGDVMNLVFVDHLVMTNFPASYEDQNIDQGIGLDIQHISLFESMIPADYYNMLIMIYDSVRFFMDIRINSNFDEHGSMQFVGDSNQNGIYQYLRENQKLVSSFDIQLRSRSNGSFTSLSEIQGIAEQLPMELPIVDTTNSHLYWSKNQKSPLAEVVYNMDYDSVYSVTFRYAQFSNIENPLSNMLKVYPNPSSDYINFNLENYKDIYLFVQTTDGKTIAEIKLDSHNTQIDLSNYSAGVYIYNLLDKNRNAIAAGKFIKN